MRTINFTTNDGFNLVCSLWNDINKPIGVVQIIHGMDEHVMRYERFAKFLNKHGYIAFGDDHRAHGRTAKDISMIGKTNGDPDLFASIVSDEIAIYKYLSKKYKLPVFIFSHSYGSFIAQRIIEEPNLSMAAVCLSGTAKYPLALAIPGLIASFIGEKIFDPDAPARLIEYFSPIRNHGNGDSKLTRDKKQVELHEKDTMHVRYFSYGFYYSLFKNLIKLSGNANKNLPILIISGGNDPVSMNAKLAKNLYNNYKSKHVKNLTLIIYPGARHELLLELNYKQVQQDILSFFNSILNRAHKKKSV